MFRMIRRAPWIALGAAGAYYLDASNGPSRRRAAAAKVREWGSALGGPWSAVGTDGGPPPPADAPLTPSVPRDRVRSRAAEPLAEEQAAGVDEPASPAMAEQILTESERRVTDRAGTESEHRRSQDTVEPEALTGGR